MLDVISKQTILDGKKNESHKQISASNNYNREVKVEYFIIWWSTGVRALSKALTINVTCIERWSWWREGKIINENCPLNISLPFSLTRFVIAQPWKLPTIIFYCISYRISSFISHHVDIFFTYNIIYCSLKGKLRKNNRKGASLCAVDVFIVN